MKRIPSLRIIDSVDEENDYIPIFDNSDDETKKIPLNIIGSGATYNYTETATTVTSADQVNSATTVTSATNVQEATTVTNATNVYEIDWTQTSSNFLDADPSESDQGVTGGGDTIYALASGVGATKKAVIALRHNGVADTTTYTLDTSIDWSSYPNLYLYIEPGAMLARTTGDETFTIYDSSHLLIGGEQHITSVAMIAFAIACTVRPEWWGALGNGVTNDAPALQYAVTAAKTHGTILLGPKHYFLSSTIVCLSTQKFIGQGVNSTVFKRTGNYGDTLYFTNAGAAEIRHIWFMHDNLPSAGFTSLDNKVTTGAHVHFSNGQGAVIEDCWFWRMYSQIQIDQGAVFKINRCNFNGVFNRWYVAGQEGHSSIFLGYGGYTQLIDITNCYFGGSNSGAQDVDYVISDNGTQTVNYASSNAGAQFGIIAYSCEGLLIDGCYIGGNAYNNIMLSANTTLNQVRITNNFFDGAGYDQAMIYIAPQSDGHIVTTTMISNNCFNGELVGVNAIKTYNGYGSTSVLTDFTITGNTGNAILGTPFHLQDVAGGVIANNTMVGYNGRNLTPGGDVNYCVGIYLVDSSNISITDNVLGGATNSAAFPAYTYQGVSFGGTLSRITSKNNAHNGYHLVPITANFTADGANEYIAVDTTSGVIQVTPPTTVPDGWTITLKDAVGNVATNAMQFIATVEGVANPVYNTNWDSVTLTKYGSAWIVKH